MNVLEKILEEIGNASIKVSTVGLPHKYFKAIGTKKIEEIIRSNMDDVPDNNAGWIPVSEKLPEARQHDNGEPIEFIAMIKGAEVPTVLSINEQDEWFSYDEMFYGEGRYNNYDVVAWQPLPEPYKEE